MRRTAGSTGGIAISNKVEGKRRYFPATAFELIRNLIQLTIWKKTMTAATTNHHHQNGDKVSNLVAHLIRPI